MDEIITNGSVAAASSPGFRMKDKTLDTAIDMEDVECDDAEEEEEPTELEPSAKGRKKKKRLTDARTGEPRIKWKPKEDGCLAEAWKTVSIDPITNVNQNSNTY
ncbi:Rho GTPase-activating protein 24 [Hordeum vulgare]|nr:Rho GTPase-activating protein 24 [Hordeum vulgare]